MKVYDLSCGLGHRFEGWFSSEDNFVSQSTQHLIACPVCDSKQVGRLPTAPHLNLSGNANRAPEAPVARLPWEDALQKLVAETEDVGENFAAEARRIHYNEAPERGIRGTSSAEERRALAEEGIDVIALPFPVPPKRTLQ